MERIKKDSHRSKERNNNYIKPESINNGTRATRSKVFVARQSLLTELFEVAHIRTIYHIFIVILILLFLNTIIYDLVDRGSINIGVGLIKLGFGKVVTWTGVWCCMQAASLLPPPLLHLWAGCRHFFIPMGTGVLQFWDAFWLCFLILFQVTFIVLPYSSIVYFELPIVSSLIISIETIRFVMKIHAYVRSVSPRVLSGNLKAVLPSFSCYLYFMFAPTLVYRDSYPRSSHIRWGVVAARLLEIAAIIFYISFLIERFLLGSFSHFGKPNEVLEAKELVLTVFGSMLPALLTYLCGFYLLLHSWLNATAEVLRFADRQFYMDWWTQSSYAIFYRTWNMVVHDWLYTYIYTDVLRLTGNKLLGTLLVFVISAIFHEVVLAFSFGFFYPVLLVFFGILSVMLVFLTKHFNPSAGNIFMWWTLAVGNGLLWSMYSAEYFARRNCPEGRTEGLVDLFIPRSWVCHQIALHPNWKFQNPLEH